MNKCVFSLDLKEDREETLSDESIIRRPVCAHSCPRRVNANNKNTPSMHRQRRRNVTVLQWLDEKKQKQKTATYAKIVNLKDIAGNAEKEGQLYNRNKIIATWEGGGGGGGGLTDTGRPPDTTLTRLGTEIRVLLVWIKRQELSPIITITTILIIIIISSGGGSCLSKSGWTDSQLMIVKHRAWQSAARNIYRLS